MHITFYSFPNPSKPCTPSPLPPPLATWGYTHILWHTHSTMEAHRSAAAFNGMPGASHVLCPGPMLWRQTGKCHPCDSPTGPSAIAACVCCSPGSPPSPSALHLCRPQRSCHQQQQVWSGRGHGLRLHWSCLVAEQGGHLVHDAHGWQGGKVSVNPPMAALSLRR